MAARLRTATVLLKKYAVRCVYSEEVLNVNAGLDTKPQSEWNRIPQACISCSSD